MIRILAAFGCLLFTPFAAAQESPPPPAAGEWVQLFNGKDLTGWTPKINGYPAGENFADTFRVADGLLTVSYDKYDAPFNERYGHLFWKDKLSSYRLRIEYRFIGQQAPGGQAWALRNSGVMIHGETADSMRVTQRFPTSIEVQFLGGAGDGVARPTANLCTPGTHVFYNGKLHTPHETRSKSKTYDGDQWVTVEVEVHGNGKIKHMVNGETVLEYEQAQLDPRDTDGKRILDSRGGNLMISEGSISLQSESHPIQFRKVELLVLKE